MKSFIENSLGIEVDIEAVNLNNRLPMLYNSLYDFKRVSTKEFSWLMVIPKEQINLSQIRKHHRQMEKVLGLHCAIYLKKTSPYSKNTMIADGIPFIIEDKEIYLPFLGLLLSQDKERELKPVQKISFLTQKILLMAIYEKWQDMNVTKVSLKLDVTKMSVSRCFDEIEFMDIPVLELKGKSRVITIGENRKELWNSIKPVLRNPVLEVFVMETDLNLDIKGGISALSEYSMIEDNSYPTYVVMKKDIGELKLRDYKQSPRGEKPGCLVQEIGYYIPFGDKKGIDPLSLYLSLSEDEIEDERIEKSVREMLEEYVW